MSTRRDFLKHSSIAALGIGAHGVLPRRWHRQLDDYINDESIADQDYRELALRAIDAGRSAGAAYVDVRITRWQVENINSGISEKEMGRDITRGRQFAIGVRVLVGGAWGFASSFEVTPDETVRLARAAVAQTKQLAWGTGRNAIELSPVSPVPNGTWIMPIEQDPFAVPTEQKLAHLEEMAEAALRIPDVGSASGSMNFERQQKTFASSEGSVLVQTTYRSWPTFSLIVRDAVTRHTDGSSADLSPMGMGYELMIRSRPEILEQLPQLAELARMKLRAKKIVDVGRYDVVFDARSLAEIVGDSIGYATELDRAMGLEANARGTSYLAPPATMLGTFKLGPEILNVKADRSQINSCGRVQWDDEGVVPEDFLLIKKGVVNDYQTTREQPAWLGDWYRKQGISMRSHGCAGTGSSFTGLDTVIQHQPNISIVPSPTDSSFHDLVASTAKGLAFTGGSGGDVDQQFLNYQLGADTVYEIKNGKLGEVVKGAACVLRAPQFWKSLVALGGARSYRLGGASSDKGQPEQSSYRSIGTVPAKFTKVDVINSSVTP